MSLRTLESAIILSARGILNNPKLRLKDLMEWSTGEVKGQDDEVVIFVPNPGVNAAFPKTCDKRVPAKSGATPPPGGTP